jgi:glycosyltransferase involved in cell wall biosynthesis
MSHKNPTGQQLKILFISHSSNLYGAEQSLLALVNNLPDNKIPVLLFPQHGPIISQLNSNIKQYFVNYKTWFSKRKNLLKSLYVTFFNFIALKKVVQLCKKEQINLIYSNTLANPLGLYISKHLGIPHIYHIREFVGNKAFAKFVISESKAWETINTYTRLFIYNSKSVKSYYQNNITSSQQYVVYNGIKEPTKHRQVQRQNNLFIMVGYFTKRKNPIDALQAIRLLNSRGHSLKLKLIGDIAPDYKPELINIIQEQNLDGDVDLAGFSVDLTQNYQECTGLIHCAVQEAWGRVIIEAMLNNCPVIAANNEGAAEIIQHGKNGFIYSMGNVESLADQMKSVISEKDLLKTITHNAYIESKEKYSISNYVTNITNKINLISN